LQSFAVAMRDGTAFEYALAIARISPVLHLAL
jgi:hypothetical protein